MSPMGTPCQPTESTLSRNSRGVAELPDGSTWLSVVARHAGELQSIQQQLQRSDVARGLHVLRVNQMDALRLDDEMRLMLKEQLMRVVALVPAAWVARGEAELELLLDVLVWADLSHAGGNGSGALPCVDGNDVGVSWASSSCLALTCYFCTCTFPLLILLDFLPPSPLPPTLPTSPHSPHFLPLNPSVSHPPPPSPTLLPLRPSLSPVLHLSRGSRSLPTPLHGHVAVRTGVEGPGLTVGQKVLWLVLTGGVKYVWARLHSTHWLLPVHAHMPHNAYARHGSGSEALQRQQASWRHWLWRLLHRAEGAVKLASLLNLVVFLHSAKFRTLPERLLGIRAVYAKPHMARAVSFEYMNRQLVWNEFSELLLLVLPLISVSAIKHTFSSLFRLPSSSSPTAGDGCPRAHSPPCGDCSAPRGCARAAWRGDGQADRRKIVACRAAESGDVVPADWVDTAGTHKRPRQVFYSKKVRHGPFNGDKAGGEWGAEGGGGGMGEKFLFQAGEQMELLELPEGTRVVYPGLCKDGESNPNKPCACCPPILPLPSPSIVSSPFLHFQLLALPSLPHSVSLPRTHVCARPCVHTGLDTQQMRAMVRHAMDNLVGQPSLKERLQQIKQANPNPKVRCCSCCAATIATASLFPTPFSA
ncbi:unnamed protein product [Closterium sp. NIES-53]